MQLAIVACAIAMCFATVNAQVPRTVDVDQLIVLARANAPDKLRADALTIQASRWKETGSNLFPSRPMLTLDYDTEQPFGSNDYQFSVSLSQELSLWGIGTSRNVVAESFSKAADSAHASVQARIDLTTRLMYNKARTLALQVALADKLVQSSNRLVEATNRRLAAGDISVLDRNSIVLSANLQRIEYEQVSSKYEQALAELEALTGLQLQNVTLEIDTTSILTTDPGDSTVHYQLWPEWVRLNNAIQIEQAQVELARISLKPNPTLWLTYSRDRLSIAGNEVRYLPGASASIDNITSPGQSVGVQLSMTIPISIVGLWRPNTTNVALREAALLELQAEQNELRISLAGRFVKLKQQLLHIRNALQIYEQSIALIVQSDELLSRGYEGGELSVTELVVGRQQLATMQSGQLDLVRQFHDTEILLRSITNR